jgi:hypothetical protein
MPSTPETPAASATPPSSAIHAIPAAPAILPKPAASAPSRTATPLIPALGSTSATDGLPGNPSKIKPVKFKSGRIGLTLKFSGVESSLATMSAFVLPGEVLEVQASGGSGLYAASSRTGTLVADDRKPLWRWTAPAVHGGDHQIRIRDRGKGGKDVAMLRVFVMRPYAGGPTIDAFPIGSYSPPPEKNAAAFAHPKGFLEITAKDHATPVSPHFKLGQFRGKEEVDGKSYMALRPSLLLKLEKVLEELARRGLATDTLSVVSGFRTPAYNSRIGNETSLSRHLYGDAADFFLDRDGDGEMDDLTSDGLVSWDDAVVLYDLVDKAIDGGKSTGPLAGGLSIYPATAQHGPMVHVDTRGVRVRW